MKKSLLLAIVFCTFSCMDVPVDASRGDSPQNGRGSVALTASPTAPKRTKRSYMPRIIAIDNSDSVGGLSDNDLDSDSSSSDDVNLNRMPKNVYRVTSYQEGLQVLQSDVGNIFGITLEDHNDYFEGGDSEFFRGTSEFGGNVKTNYFGYAPATNFDTFRRNAMVAGVEYFSQISILERSYNRLLEKAAKLKDSWDETPEQKVAAKGCFSLYNKLTKELFGILGIIDQKTEDAIKDFNKNYDKFEKLKQRIDALSEKVGEKSEIKELLYMYEGTMKIGNLIGIKDTVENTSGTKIDMWNKADLKAKLVSLLEDKAEAYSNDRKMFDEIYQGCLSEEEKKISDEKVKRDLALYRKLFCDICDMCWSTVPSNIQFRLMPDIDDIEKEDRGRSDRLFEGLFERLSGKVKVGKLKKETQKLKESAGEVLVIALRHFPYHVASLKTTSEIEEKVVSVEKKLKKRKKQDFKPKISPVVED